MRARLENNDHDPFAIFYLNLLKLSISLNFATTRNPKRKTAGYNFGCGSGTSGCTLGSKSIVLVGSVTY
jgi:hypothetical protein